MGVDAPAASVTRPPSGGRTCSRPRVGLVLGAGGARGLAHVGALKVLHSRQTPIDLVVGVSIGSVIGAAFAAGRSPAWMERLALDLNFGRLFHPRPSRNGLVDPTALRRLVDDLVGGTRFSDLDRELVVIASSLGHGGAVMIRDGRVADAVLASTAVPLVFPPVRYDDDYLLDGALVDGLPVAAARAAGADIVVAVDVDNHARRPVRAPGLGHLACQILSRSNARSSGAPSRALLLARTLDHLARPPAPHAAADVVIRPQFGPIAARHFSQAALCVALGETAAGTVLPTLELALAS